MKSKCTNFAWVFLTTWTNRQCKHFFGKNSRFPGNQTKVNPFVCHQLHKITTY